jgi:ubiquinone biosynthesis protein
VFLGVLSTARDLGRLREIAAVLIRHGLGDVVRRLGMARVLERAGRAVHWKARSGPRERPRRARAWGARGTRTDLCEG